ncbi:uncharacterized protein LOC119523302 [Choloepus didactylus]|uniref:uncharacterized protein LOC119523302 n=1 Tax=Choloepus didactylus TaxID=27675 RepID=UPI0018A10439|nr:uncharacterized protein LOC119523302 [Choloepus didactylus]
MKQHLLWKMSGLFLSYLSLAFGLVLAKSKSWRVWVFDSTIIPVVFIGLWEAFYLQSSNVSGTLVELPVYSQINKSWIVSNEIKYSQDLMLLDNITKSLALVFGSVAFFVSWIDDRYSEVLRSCYKNAAIFLFLSCACTVGTVSWNFAVDFLGQTTLNFPQNFPIAKEILRKKRLSYVFPLGITTASLSLISSAMFFWENYLPKRQNEVEPMTVTRVSEQKDLNRGLLFFKWLPRVLKEISCVHVTLP